MKRDTNLQPLSRQHHNGLLAALLVGKGLKKGADLRVMADFIVQVWTDELQSHFMQEEQVLIPALQHTVFDPAFTQRLLQEHRQIESLVNHMRENRYTKEDFSTFCTLLEAHIRFEERIYFPEAEKTLSTAALEQIGTQLHEEPDRNCMNYPVRFWE